MTQELIQRHYHMLLLFGGGGVAMFIQLSWILKDGNFPGCGKLDVGK